MFDVSALRLKNAHEHISETGEPAVRYCGWYCRCLEPWEADAPSGLPQSYQGRVQAAVESLLIRCGNSESTAEAKEAMRRCTRCLQQLACYMHCGICHSDALQKLASGTSPGEITPQNCPQGKSFSSNTFEEGACVHLNYASCENLRRTNTYPNLLLLQTLDKSLQDFSFPVTPEQCAIALLSISDKCEDIATAFMFWLYVILLERNDILDTEQKKIPRTIYTKQFRNCNIFTGQKITLAQLGFEGNKDALFQAASDFLPIESDLEQAKSDQGHLRDLINALLV